MIQRIQSIYLFLAFVVSGILSLFIPLWKNAQGTDFYAGQNTMFVIGFGLSAALAVISFLGYKKRQTQFVYNRLNMILNFILLGLFVYQSLNLSGEASVSEKGIGMFLPVVSIILLALANKAIKKDEDLVKSADRIR
jgi:membrane protease YdiL (CAAX protease family)